jgi:hypothetical protein
MARELDEKQDDHNDDDRSPERASETQCQIMRDLITFFVVPDRAL